MKCLGCAIVAFFLFAMFTTMGFQLGMLALQEKAFFAWGMFDLLGCITGAITLFIGVAISES